MSDEAYAIQSVPCFGHFTAVEVKHFAIVQVQHRSGVELMSVC